MSWAMCVQELMSKGLTAADIDAALQGVFGDDMAISVPREGYDDEDDDEHVTTDTRYGEELTLQGRCPTS